MFGERLGLAQRWTASARSPPRSVSRSAARPGSVVRMAALAEARDGPGTASACQAGEEAPVVLFQGNSQAAAAGGGLRLKIPRRHNAGSGSRGRLGTDLPEEAGEVLAEDVWVPEGGHVEGDEKVGDAAGLVEGGRVKMGELGVERHPGEQ